MLTSYGIKETTELGITREIIDIWRKNALTKETPEKTQNDIIASFLIGEGELVVEI